MTLGAADDFRLLMHDAVTVDTSDTDADADIVNAASAVFSDTASDDPSTSLTRSQADDVDAETDAVADALCTRSPVAVDATDVAETMVCKSAESYTL